MSTNGNEIDTGAAAVGEVLGRAVLGQDRRLLLGRVLEVGVLLHGSARHRDVGVLLDPPEGDVRAVERGAVVAERVGAGVDVGQRGGRRLEVAPRAEPGERCGHGPALGGAVGAVLGAVVEHRRGLAVDGHRGVAADDGRLGHLDRRGDADLVPRRRGDRSSTSWTTWAGAGAVAMYEVLVELPLVTNTMTRTATITTTSPTAPQAIHLPWPDGPGPGPPCGLPPGRGLLPPPPGPLAATGRLAARLLSFALSCRCRPGRLRLVAARSGCLCVVGHGSTVLASCECRKERNWSAATQGITDVDGPCAPIGARRAA